MKFIASLFSILILTALGFGVFVHLQMQAPLAQQKFVDIPRGAGINSITSILESAQLLTVNRAIFKLVVLATNSDGTLKAGQYEVTPETSSYELLELIRKGKIAQHRITLVEGWTLKQIRQTLANAPFLGDETSHMNGVELAAELGIEGNVEGWLFPDTYQYIKDDSDLMILTRSYDKMKATLDDEWNKRAVIGTLAGKYDALILASMIEKETGYEPDRLKVATVFHNRLNRGMKLQSDPTVIYGLGDEFDGDLKRYHLTTTSGHNTYMRRGLPVTPICSPGLASIEAALTAPSGEYLYFVAKGNGESHFSFTLKEHNRAVLKYQKVNGGKLQSSERAGGDTDS